MSDVDIYVEEEAAVSITIDENTAYVIEVPGISAASIVTTKGDLLGYSINPERHPVGADGYILTADSSESRGIKWSAPAANNIISEGNSSVEVDDTTAGVITLTTDAHDIMTLQTLHQPITISHDANFLDTNTPLVYVEASGEYTSKGAVLWLKTGKSASPVDINVFRIDNSAGAIFSILNNGSMSINSGQGITEFSTDTTLAGNSDTALPTEKAVKTYVDTQLSTVDVLTTKGDLHTYSTTDARLPVGTDNYVLVADSSQATGLRWAAGGGSGMADPMTTRGDMIYRNSSNTTARLPIGTNTQVLTSNGTDVAWATPAAVSGDKITEGDSSVEVIDAGTGEIVNTVNANEVLTVKADTGNSLSGIWINNSGDITSNVYVDIQGQSTGFAVLRATVQSSDEREPIIRLKKTRGSIGSPSNVVSGDVLGELSVETYAGGTTYPARILFQVDGTVSNGVTPTKIAFQTSPDTYTNRVDRFVIDPVGNCRPGVDNNQDLGTSSYRWDDIYATNATIQTSDRRMKKDINPLELGLDFINTLAPVEYKWADLTVSGTTKHGMLDDDKTIPNDDFVQTTHFNRKHFGLIAQDVELAIDEYGLTTKDFAGFIYDEKTDRYGLRYNEFIAPMIKAIQELSAKNKELKHNLSDLETQHLLLLKRIEALEAK